MRLTFRLRRLESDEGIEEAQIHGGLPLRLQKYFHGGSVR